MRYDIDSNNYITNVYFNCNSGTCVEYTGSIPDGYTSLEEWASNSNIQAYKIVDGNLVYDSARDEELQEQWAIEEKNCSPVIDLSGYAEKAYVDSELETKANKEHTHSDYLPLTGGTVTGVIRSENKSEFGALQKVRTVNDVDYKAVFGVGSVNNQGTAALEIQSASGEKLGRIDVLPDGKLRNGMNGGIFIDSTDSRIKETNIITAGINSTITISEAGNNIIALNKVVAQIGTGLTLENGKIVVGSGIKNVLVSGNGMLTTKAATNVAKNFTILKNGTKEVTLSMNTITTTANSNISRAMTPRIEPVSEGDYFEYRVYAAVGDTISNADARNYITIQAL